MLRPGQVVVLCALALLAIGLVMVTSAGLTVEPVETLPVGDALAAVPTPPDDTTHSVGHSLLRVATSRPAVYLALAVAALVVGSLLPVRALADRLGRPGSRAPLGLALGTVLILAVLATSFIPGLGREVNGSQRWVRLPMLGGLSFQPSEFAKWGLALLVAWYAASRQALMHRFWLGLLPGLAAAAIVAAAVAYEDLGTGTLIGLVAGAVLLAGGARLWHFLAFVPPAVAGFVVLVLANPYRLTRLQTFLDPYADPKKAGYHMIQSLGAVANGEGFGRGLGFGLQKFGYLPEDTTDFLFAIICEELGIAGAAVVVSLYVALLVASVLIIRRQPSLLLKLAALGIITTVGIQALINLTVVTGLAPTKGIALPLVSAGGTGWILTAFCLGLLVAIDRAAPRHEPEPLPALA
ncbi:MAG: FtsW/RodA/SpoVE family cell cycle protein [Phycisphaerae bacterium]|nr:FtsW/RodA/SpoVE family cell cycle protein [Phycisphaerae bacterium]